ncbi:acylneuraminate cytidylyltransferase family protein [Dolichospermum circinale CS-545/17]|nr:acylneuraminate cytidylyltransferase family protein [Dolichospermum circinale CS-545/17]
MTIKCFIPCRKGSERVPRKNIRPFAGYEHGLFEIKLKQILAVSYIDEVVLSTNDEEILNFANQIHNPKLRLHKRIESLSSSKTSTDELIAHALELIPSAHILWTHVTSPFINSQDYEGIIKRYLEALKQGYDSLMTTTLIHSFLWNEQKPINYDRNFEKWPRTQTLEPIHEVNSGVFLSHSSNYKVFNDRIGCKPLLYPLNKIQSFDIDYEEDFAIAECIAKAELVEI